MPPLHRASVASAATLALAVGGSLLLLIDRPAVSTTAAELRWTTGHAATDALAPLVVETLAANRRDIVGQLGPVPGFGAGAHYPQLWIRDSATLLPVARWTEPLARLDGWLREHLVHQAADGRLHDWIAQGEPATFAADAPAVREIYRNRTFALSGDRNTSEMDQESSAVLAAAEVFAVTGDRAWLTQDVGGLPLVDRLERALTWLAAHRDRSLGLLVGPLTADWGDVTPTHGDQRAIYDDPATPRVAALYPNALLAGASRQLAGLLRAAGHHERAAAWDRTAKEVARALDAHLWDDTLGFYRIHLPADATPAAEGNEQRFAMGGNAVAALHGVASNERTCRILAAAEARRAENDLSTIAATIVPPFPSGFFRHPILREPWTYQNGGQWDWFSGRLLTAAFRAGCADAARLQLDRVAARSMAAGGLYEWYDREDHGRGSARYAGTAAALGQAVVEGLFGVSLRHRELDLSVRLGDRPGRLRLGEPSTGVRIDVAWDGHGRLVTRSSRGGSVRVLVPAGQAVGQAWLDGADVVPEVEDVGADRYAGVLVPAGEHELVLAFVPGR